jgi:hypothetical protein
MLTYKRFSRFLLYFLALFFLYNVVIWNCFTKRFLGGDLARIGYLYGVKSIRNNSIDLPRRHVEQEDYKGERIDLITIGDSFSNGGGEGKNKYYQDYIASINNIGVMNIEPFKEKEQELDPITLASIYVNNGYFDSIRPRYVLISSVERECVIRFSRRIDFDRCISMEGFTSLKRIGYQRKKNDIGKGEKEYPFAFINEGNFKLPLYNVYYNFSDHAFFSKTYKKKLNTSLFTLKDGKTLLFFYEDLLFIAKSNRASIAGLNDNLNRLADKLARKGIKLYFMPCVDKYNLYSEFIVNNRHPQSTFFELLRPLPKRYTFIDTKSILLKELRKGEKDISHVDDTHWTWKASKKIFETVRFDSTYPLTAMSHRHIVPLQGTQSVQDSAAKFDGAQ